MRNTIFVTARGNCMTRFDFFLSAIVVMCDDNFKLDTINWAVVYALMLSF